VLVYDGRRSVIERVRVLGYFTNADGMCLHSCRDCRVTRCFVHTADDCYEVKAKGRGVVFEDSQVWCDAGTTMGVTHEIDGLMTDITWRNITVLHYTHRANPPEGIVYRGAILIHPAMGGTVKDVRFENITIERCSTRRPVVLISNVKKPRRHVHHFPDKPFSPISGVVVDRLRADNALDPQIVIIDQSGRKLIRDIRFRDVIMNGRPLVAGDPRLRLDGDIRDVRVTGARKTSR
jgi:hypothetical protein